MKLHLVGKSQSGKSTALFVAASIWGKGARDGQVRSWRHTGNGLEGIANETSDLCLILDEFGEASTQEIGNIIYMLANAIGKGRANELGNARENSYRTTQPAQMVRSEPLPSVVR